MTDTDILSMNDAQKRPAGPQPVSDEEVRGAFRHCDLEWDVMSTIVGIALEVNEARRTAGTEPAHDA